MYRKETGSRDGESGIGWMLKTSYQLVLAELSAGGIGW
jgi:hypothetical protein